ncbi:hypothetical protein GCM10009759_28850 [Kitasatospora saccharophila]|uniref:Uncharacterized protein n=1 Tax=Kitasatospora saccharophila TaxID=407973 RepID=A0ABN2WSV2_9ACTN
MSSYDMLVVLPPTPPAQYREAAVAHAMNTRTGRSPGDDGRRHVDEAGRGYLLATSNPPLRGPAGRGGVSGLRTPAARPPTR